MLSWACSIAPTSLSALKNNNKGFKNGEIIINIGIFLPDMPEHDCSVRTATAEETFVNWMPRDTGSLLFMSPKGLHLLAKVSQIEQLQ